MIASPVTKEVKEVKEVTEVTEINGNDPLRVQLLFSQIWNKAPTPGNKISVENMIKNYGHDKVKSAFIKADEAGIYTIRYVQGILNNPDKPKKSLKENKGIGE